MTLWQKTMFNLKKQKSIIKKEETESKHIPIIRHVNDFVLKTVNDDYIFTFKLTGLAYETINDTDLDLEAESRNVTFSSFIEKPVVFYSHSIRRKIQIKKKKIDYESGFLNVLDSAYNSKFSDHSYYINELYLTLLYRNSKISKLSKKQNLQEREERIISEIKDYIINLKGAFVNYNVHLLGVRKEENNNKTIFYSEPMEFLSKIINVESYKMRMPLGSLNSCISLNRKIFGRRNIEILTSTKSKFGVLITIKNYCQNTYAGMLDQLSSLDCEFVLTQTWKTQSRQKSIESIALKKRQMDDGDYAVSLANDLNHATNEIASNNITMGENHFSLYLYAETLEHLDDCTGLAQAELSSLGIESTIDKLNTELAFWAQIPGNTAYIARKGTISSYNYAHFSSYHNLPLGKKEGNKWGDYVCVMTTQNDTPYYKNWHYKDVGMTTVIGPAGSGKTVVLLLMVAQSMKFSPSVFFFDKDKGAKIFIKASGGEYSDINLGESTKWNPLSLDLNLETNKEFVSKFIKELLKDKKELSANESASVTDIVNTIKDMPISMRVLNKIEPLIMSTLPNRAAAFRRWVTDRNGRIGEYAWCFDNQTDELDISKKTIYGFDMTSFLDIPEIRTPILMYLFKRIENTLDGTPTIIVVDECQKPSEDKFFRQEMENHAYTIRKRNGILVMATQRAKKMNVNEGLVEQSQNQIFFANPKASDEDYKTFALSNRELDIIRKLPQKKGWFLLKRPDGSVILKADLTGCDDELAVLSARSETLNLLDELILDVGDDPSRWLPLFYKRWRNA